MLFLSLFCVMTSRYFRSWSPIALLQKEAEFCLVIHAVYTWNP